jgi:hypothetical protein
MKTIEDIRKKLQEKQEEYQEGTKQYQVMFLNGC